MAGTVALGGGLVVARDGDSVSDPFALRAAVTEEPELAWTWDAETGVNMVSPMDQGALVVLRDGAVVALDEDGAEQWRQDVRGAGYAMHDESSNVVHVLSSASEEREVTALDAETGQELWVVPADWVTTVRDATVVINEDQLHRIDPEDGSEIWSVGIDGYGAVSEDGVYGFKDGDLHAWDLDGDEAWVSEAELGDRPAGAGNTVAAQDDFVAAAGPGSEVVGVDSETGDELWRDDPGYEGGVGSIEPDLAFTFPMSDSSSSEGGANSPQETTVYDRDGEVATLPLDRHSFFAVVAIEFEGEPHFVATDAGVIYDEDFEEVGSVPLGNVQATLTGVYDMGDDSISYVPYGAEEPRWTVDTESSEWLVNLVPSDGYFLVIEDATLSLYR